MDDLKLYRKNKKELESLAETVWIITEDVRMRFRLQKFVQLTMEKDKEDGVEVLLPHTEMMKDLGEGDYKYLRALEACNLSIEKMKEAVTKKYKNRLKQLLKSKLNGGNMIKTWGWL